MQEALNNTAKHANAGEILIAVSGTDILIEVRGNGAGFNSALRSEPGLGLVGIKERVRQLGGDSDISSRPDSGTALLARIPLRFSPEAA